MYGQEVIALVREWLVACDVCVPDWLLERWLEEGHDMDLIGTMSEDAHELRDE